MAFVPSSKVWICKVPWDVTYKNQIYFNSVTEQNSYFDNLTMDECPYKLDDYIIVRKVLPSGALQSSIKVGINIDYLYRCNYLRYQNTSHGNRWFYAFITNFIYVNENTTEIVFETDVWQTWCFDIEIKQSYVVREHPITDNLGEHYIPENFNINDYEYLHMTSLGEGIVLTRWGYLIGSSQKLHPSTVNSKGRLHSGIYQGLYFYYFDGDEETSISKLNALLELAETEYSDCIQFIALIPRFCISNADVDTSGFVNQTTEPNSWENDGYSVRETDKHFDGYKPKNNKLFSSPYFNLYASNHNGSEAVYDFERFYDGEWGKNIEFKVYGDISTSPSIVYIPRKYNGCAENFDFGISLNSFPQCSYNSDTFKLWLAKNQFNNATSLAVNGAMIMGGLASAFVTGGASLVPAAMAGAGTSLASMIGSAGSVGLMISGARGIASTMGNAVSASHEPNRVNQGNSKTNLLTAIDSNNIDFYIRKIRRSFAENLDSYFTMFGYQTNKLKVPNLSSRPYFNYVQTADVNIVAKSKGLPNDDMVTLKNMFNVGVTLWKPNATIGDYSVDNRPQ